MSSADRFKPYAPDVRAVVRLEEALPPEHPVHVFVDLVRSVDLGHFVVTPGPSPRRSSRWTDRGHCGFSLGSSRSSQSATATLSRSITVARILSLVTDKRSDATPPGTHRFPQAPDVSPPSTPVASLTRDPAS